MCLLYSRQRHADYFQQAAPSMRQMATASGALAGIFNGGVYLAGGLTLMVGFAMLTVTGSSSCRSVRCLECWRGAQLYGHFGIGADDWFLGSATNIYRSRIATTDTAGNAGIFAYEGDYQPDTITIRGTKVSFHYPQTNREILQHLDFQIHNQGITF